jgi:hypothetical protein
MWAVLSRRRPYEDDTHTHSHQRENQAGNIDTDKSSDGSGGSDVSAVDDEEVAGESPTQSPRMLSIGHGPVRNVWELRDAIQSGERPNIDTNKAIQECPFGMVSGSTVDRKVVLWIEP